jgi:hypothetical protein
MPAIWRNVNRIHTAGFIALTAFGLATTSSFADTVPGSMPDFLMTWDASLDPTDPQTYNPDDFRTQETTWGTWQVGGQDWTGWRYVGGLTSEFWTLTWDCIVNEDPFVVATINVTNTASTTQNFSNYMALPIAGPINPTLMNGSVSAGLVNNSPFSTGASLSSGVDPIYQAFIDPGVNPPAASASRTMWNGFALSTPQFVPNANANDSFAGEIGPAAFSSIALKLQFDLSAGDTASVTGIFQIAEVPGPAGLAVFALFGMVGTRRRR